ncbi:ketopantoate reductase family protein [Dactylosporangium fulvum]|uniref:2-dehydropantoate 2-reductase n=1 Tax=Dactylosporangium fulvum TaxID=53359 RepID=A0ABY5W6L3_9ACTN|nr:ketopantoate reductase family protein [Dactylosporangium fulvum]UWP85638.1 ketopantoate reductase family protein [Dactylosporangium fulvum]
MSATIWVVGAGGIGASIAARLAGAGQQVVVIDDWAEHVDRIREHGLTLEHPGGVLHTRPAAILSSELSELSVIADTAPPDLVLLAVKSDRTRETLLAVADRLPPGCPVLSLQNGLNEPVIADVVGPTRTVGAVVRFDGALAGPGRVTQQRSDGDLVIGAVDRAAAGLVAGVADQLRTALPVVVSDRIWADLWSKLTRNCLLNPVSTLVGLGLGRMAALPPVREVCLRTGLEVIAVARATGVAVEPGILYGTDLDRLFAGDPAAVRDFQAAFERTYAPFPDLKPSMLQDAEKGRSVEVRWLNGAVVDAGERVGVAAPLNRALTERVEELVRGVRTPGTHNLEGLT